MSAESSIALVVAYVGALRLGAVVVPVNTGYREREVAHVVHDARPVAAIVDDGERAAWMAVASQVPLVRFAPQDIGAGSTVERDRELDLALELDSPGPHDLALLCYTSGTTGAPKGAMLRHSNLLASIEAVRLAWRWTPQDRLVLTLPLFHVHGLGVGINGTLHAGASAVLLPRFEADAVLDATAAHEATLFFGVPTMWTRGWRRRRGWASWPACGWACPARRRCPPSSTAAWPRSGGQRGARALRHVRDADERLQPAGRRAAAGHRRSAAAGRGGPPRRRGRGGGAAARPERLRRVLGAARGHGRGLRRRRVVPQRRPRCPRRRRLPADRRAPDQSSSSAAATTCTPARSRTCS